MSASSGAIYSARQLRELEQRAIGELGISGHDLMTRAGHATLNELRSRWPAATSLTVLCGPGNNGGDGYVVARVARAQGLRTEVFAIGDPQPSSPDACRARADFIGAGGTVRSWPGGAFDTDVIVDALFGTGLTREVTGEAAGMLRALNGGGRPIVAVDIPSGLHADTGVVLGVATRATLTVTFIGRKLGFYLGGGPGQVGELVLHDLGVPAESTAVAPPEALLLGEHDVALALPPRERASHKGRHGHVLVIGGGPGMPGAPQLAGEAALRAGAGLVTIAMHPSSLGLVAARPELMISAVESPGDLAAVLSRATVVAVGPGLGQGEWGRALFDAALESGRPLVIDADALNLLALQPRQRDGWVLTPHPGEAARLLGTTADAVQADRMGVTRDLKARYGGHVVLKGAGSIIGSPGAIARICDRGNPGMAVAGMGDVLTGVIAGIAAQCGDLGLAVRAGVFVHAVAGDRAARAGERGLLAGDLLEQLRCCVNPC